MASAEEATAGTTEAPAETPAATTNGESKEPDDKGEATSGGQDSGAPAEAQPETKTSADKAKAIEELKAAIMAAAAKPKLKKRETEELIAFCMCIKNKAAASEFFRELYDILPRIGNDSLAPLMGIKRPAPVVPKPAPVVASAQKVSGRVKSYNTRKGFGFITVPGFGRDIFVYNSHLIGRIGLLAGETVHFDLVVEGGRPQARNVKATGADPGPMGLGGANVIGGQNPFAAIKQAMEQSPLPAPSQPSMRDMALAMAAAAAEVPTTIPQKLKSNLPKPQDYRTEEEKLADKIREAQEAAAEKKGGDKGSLPKSGPGSAPVSLPSKSDGGPIRTGSKVRVVDFPAPDVNGCMGTVRGYDAAAGRYQVDVEMLTGETVPMSLREEYMEVDGKAKGSSGGQGSSLHPAPPPLPGGSSNALQKSAADALRRFGQAGAAPMQQGMGNNWQFGQGGMPGGGMNFPQQTRASEAARAAANQFQAMQRMQGGGGPGGPGGGKGGPGGQMGNFGAGPMHPQAQQMGRQMPDGPGGGKGGMQGGMPFGGPGAGGPGPAQAPKAGGPPPGQNMQQMAAARGSNKLQAGQGMGPGGGPGQPGGQQMPLNQGMSDVRPGQPPQMSQAPRPPQPQGMSLERSMSGGGMMQQQQQMQQEAQMRQKQGQPGQPGQPIQHVLQQISQMTSQQAQQQPGQPQMRPPAPPAASTKPPGSTSEGEGRPGQVWVVMHSPYFQDVIVRATQEVTSKELRRILPGEVCTQRDLTVTLPNGLVRMPVQPDGWVTAHARNINGPTFLTEASNDSPAPAPGRGGAAFAGLPGAPGPDDRPMPPAPPPAQRDKASADHGRAVYSREDMLSFKSALHRASWFPKEVPADMRGLRVLHVPNMGGGKAPRDREDRERRRRRDRAEEQEDEDEGPRSRLLDRDRTPLREVPPSAAGGKEAAGEETAAAPPKTGEEKKANCPTQ
eukprot:TRINITY_DN8171_c0_g4_i1.p1 TRINITY_DN8171_c0_g4~~TRINITY_DN8171_c0_g4_i1.p1  ORF type:complete len:953 (-),score=253.71 TRINITY_DN8171_c0_g4_i1:78-2936(-)